jgi:hypothetical protein
MLSPAANKKASEPQNLHGVIGAAEKSPVGASRHQPADQGPAQHRRRRSAASGKSRQLRAKRRHQKG